jgi:hypothetical protein
MSLWKVRTDTHAFPCTMPEALGHARMKGLRRHPCNPISTTPCCQSNVPPLCLGLSARPLSIQMGKDLGISSQLYNASLTNTQANFG